MRGRNRLRLPCWHQVTQAVGNRRRTLETPACTSRSSVAGDGRRDARALRGADGNCSGDDVGTDHRQPDQEQLDHGAPTSRKVANPQGLQGVSARSAWPGWSARAPRRSRPAGAPGPCRARRASMVPQGRSRKEICPPVRRFAGRTPCTAGRSERVNGRTARFSSDIGWLRRPQFITSRTGLLPQNAPGTWVHRRWPQVISACMRVLR
jgi:hypothetical protein